MTREEAREILSKINISVGMGESFNLSENQIFKATSMAIEALEQIRWIPVSERLPEDDKKVLVYVKRKDDEKSEMNGFHIARKHYMEGDSEGKSNFWGIPIAPCEWRIEGWSYFFEPEVLAWMPLPEPYKAESEEE